MAQRGEQSVPKRSSRANTGDSEPLIYPQPTQKSGPLPRTNAYPEDEAADIPRQSTSAIRLDHPQLTSSQRITGSQPSPTMIPPRRQQRRERELRRPYNITQPYKQIKQRRSVHWLFPLGVGVLD